MIGKLIRKLFGLESGHAKRRTSGASGDSAEAEPPDAPTFLQREPLLDRKQQISAYLFSIQHPRGHRSWQASSEHFFDSVLIDRLAKLDLAKLTGRRPFLVQIQPESLLLPELDALTASNPVLCLSGAGQIAPNQRNAALARARNLRESGATLACPHGLEGGVLAELLDDATYITIEVHDLAPPDLMELTGKLRRERPDAMLIALGVDSIELFDACHRLRFDFYQGHYLTTCREEQEPKLNSQRIAVTQLISYLRRTEIDYDKLVLIARQDFALTFRLLRYINSASVGLRTKIGSLKQAMVYLGREGLYRWLTLLLFYNSKQSQTDSALRETSLGRARMCELLARRKMGNAECEQAFVTGLLSLAGVLFRTSMEKAISQLDLPKDIHDALAAHEGKFGNLLALTLACENGDTAVIDTVGRQVGLASDEVNNLYIEALGWAVEYDMGLEVESASAT